MSKLILSDVDDTVLDCSSELERFCSIRLGRQPQARLRDVFDLKAAFGITQETSDELIQEFWSSEHMGRLPPEPCAKTVLPRLYAKGYRFVAISACEDRPATRERRLSNLEAVFGFPWQDLFCTFAEPKADYLKLYQEPAIWVEDNWANCQAGGRLGHKSFLLNRPHNQDNSETPLFTRIADWHDVEAYLEITDS